MNEHNKTLFQLFKDYRWMKKLIVEKEKLSDQASDDSFLSMLNQGLNEELNDLKSKVDYVDTNIELIEDDKAYWMLNLLRKGYTGRQIVNLMQISSNTFYKKCDEALSKLTQ